MIKECLSYLSPPLVITGAKRSRSSIGLLTSLDSAGSVETASRPSFCRGGVGLARFENGDTTQSTWQTSAKPRRGARGRTDFVSSIPICMSSGLRAQVTML